MTEFPNYYQILQVSPQASFQEIKIAFRRLARQYHPDLNPNNSLAEARFKQINEAYQILNDPELRCQYDQQFNPEPSPSKTTGISAEDFYYQGLTKYQQKNYRSAIKDYTEAINLNPLFYEAYLKRIEAYYHLSDDRKVLEDCQTVLQFKDNSALVYYYLGLARQRLGYTQSALEAYHQAIHYEPEQPDFYYARALAYEELEEFSLAVKDLKFSLPLFKAKKDVKKTDIIAKKIKLLSQKIAHSYRAYIENIALFLSQLIGHLLLTLIWIITSPKNGIVSAYLRLGYQQAIAVGSLYGLLTYSYFLLNNNPDSIVLKILYLLPFLGITTLSFLGRFFSRRYGQLAGDIFLGGVSLLPIMILAIILRAFVPLDGRLQNLISLVLLVYTFLILYQGGTQISNLPKALAFFISVFMLLLASIPLLKFYLL